MFYPLLQFILQLHITRLITVIYLFTVLIKDTETN
jgi:hypothetical protein